MEFVQLVEQEETALDAFFVGARVDSRFEKRGAVGTQLD
jgi:hypothetical protein